MKLNLMYLEKKIDKRKPMKEKSEKKISEPFKGIPIYRSITFRITFSFKNKNHLINT